MTSGCETRRVEDKTYFPVDTETVRNAWAKKHPLAVVWYGNCLFANKDLIRPAAVNGEVARSFILRPTDSPRGCVKNENLSFIIFENLYLRGMHGCDL